MPNCCDGRSEQVVAIVPAPEGSRRCRTAGGGGRGRRPAPMSAPLWGRCRGSGAGRTRRRSTTAKSGWRRDLSEPQVAVGAWSGAALAVDSRRWPEAARPEGVVARIDARDRRAEPLPCPGTPGPPWYRAAPAQAPDDVASSCGEPVPAASTSTARATSGCRGCSRISSTSIAGSKTACGPDSLILRWRGTPLGTRWWRGGSTPVWVRSPTASATCGAGRGWSRPARRGAGGAGTPAPDREGRMPPGNAAGQSCRCRR